MTRQLAQGQAQERKQYWRVIAARDNADPNYTDLHLKNCDFEVGDPVNALAVAPIFYNPDTLKFEWAQRPQIDIADLDVSMGDVEALLAGNYWKQERVAYDGTGNPIYLGKNTAIGATESAESWQIWKIGWTDGNMTAKEGPRTGSWTGRAALSWGI